MKGRAGRLISAWALAAVVVLSGCSSDSTGTVETSLSNASTTEPAFTQEQLETLSPLEYYLQSGYDPELATCLADVLTIFGIESMVQFEDMAASDPVTEQIDGEVESCLATHN